MLSSTILARSAVLQSLANGGDSPSGLCLVDALRSIQIGLLSVGIDIPDIDEVGQSMAGTQRAIGEFRTSRSIRAADTLVDAALVNRLDFELSFLQGMVTPALTAATLLDPNLLRLDPIMASLMGFNLQANGLDREIIDRVRRTLDLGERMCFRLSFDFIPEVVSKFNEQIAEPMIFADFCKINGPCTNVFFDTSKAFNPYRDFLVSHNPTLAPLSQSIGKLTRPDILSHRPPDFDWYEVKPQSLYGIRDGVDKLVALLGLYLPFPYHPGRRYKPTKDIKLGTLFSPEGHQLTILLEVERTMPGLIMWALCIEGDYVEYFHRYQIVTGLLQILVGIGLILPEAIGASEAGAAIAAAVRAFAAEGGVVLTLLKATP